MFNTLRLTLIFLLLTGLLYVILFLTYTTSTRTPDNTVTTIALPIAAGLIAAPFTLRVNRFLRPTKH